MSPSCTSPILDAPSPKIREGRIADTPAGTAAGTAWANVTLLHTIIEAKWAIHGEDMAVATGPKNNGQTR